MVRVGLGSGLGGRFSCQLVIDSRMPVHDLPGSGPVTGSRNTTKN